MSQRNSSRIVNKSKAYWKHGKHAKIDPRLIRGEKKRREAEMYESVKEAFEANKKK